VVKKRIKKEDRTGVERYRERAFKIAKAQGVPDELAAEVADSQTAKWQAGIARRQRKKKEPS
jgi:hypothetical protein